MKKILFLFSLLISVLLFNNTVQAYEEYRVGDKVTYNNEEYYVIENSDSSTNYVTLLKDKPLTAEEINKYNGGEYISKNGEMIYYSGCSSIGYEKCVDSDYDNSDISLLIDNWISSFENDLVRIDGYKARLIKLDELMNNFSYEFDQFFCGNETYKPSFDTPYWIYNSDYSYWTMTSYEDSNYLVYRVFSSGILDVSSLGNGYNMIRPVINLNKCSLNDEDKMCSCKNSLVKKVTKYKSYNIGDEVEYKGEKYHVIERSYSAKNYVTLLKDEPLTQIQINKYSNVDYDYNTMILSAYYTSIKCSGRTDSDKTNNECLSDYNSSNIKKIIDKWINNQFSSEDLLNIDGYNSRLMTYQEIQLINKPWINDYSFWLMEGKISSGFPNSWTNLKDFSLLRPVINLSKSKIDYKEEYKIGDIVTYKDNNYYVIEDSDTSKDYVVLLKEIPLKYSDINKIGNYPYYISSKCNNYNQLDCINDFSSSSVKALVDNWANNEIKEDLIEVEGYKARLITMDELRSKLGYAPGSITSEVYYELTSDVFEWVYSTDYSYWTMDSFISDNENYSYTVYNNGFLYAASVNNNYAVRPVINLNKCAIDGGCYEENAQVDECVENDNIIDSDTKVANDNKSVTVANTLKTVSNVALIISLLLITSGVIILLVIKNKKERK